MGSIDGYVFTTHVMSGLKLRSGGGGGGRAYN